MIVDVMTCGLEDGVEYFMWFMIDQCVWYILVVVDGRLYGIVSIGDVVKYCIDELQFECD